MTFDLKTLTRIATYIFQVDSDFPISRLLVLLLIAKAGKRGILVRDLCAATGFAQSSISRTVSSLSDQPQRGKTEGLSFVKSTPDPIDPRRVVISITPKGEKFLLDLESLST